MHDCDNPKRIGLFKENHSVGKIAAKMPAGGRIKLAKTLGVRINLQE
jgi:hypothetical protein